LEILIFVLQVVISSVVLNFLYRQSRSILLFILQRPYSWLFFVGGLGLVWFFIGSFFKFSFNMVCWSAYVTFFRNMAPDYVDHGKEPDEDSKEASMIYSKVFRSKSGLAAFATGCTVGWLSFWGG
jgi:hypothetical protein